MSDDLSIQGELSETTVPDLFRSLIRSSETGIVTLDTPGRADTIFFSEGKIVSASSSDPDMGLAEVLLRDGDLNLRQYDEAMDRVVVSRRVGSLLLEMGYLQPEELMRAAEHQASAIVLSSLSHRNGAYKVEFTSEFPDEIITLPLHTERLVLDGIHRIEYWSLITRGLGRFTRSLERAAASDTRSFTIELTEEEGHVLSLLNEPASIEAICGQSYLSNFVTCRTLWGLLTVNLIQDAESEAVDERRAAVANEYELEALVERYNSAFQAIFGHVFQKIGDHVYDFTDRVITHVSPEMMPYLSGMNMVNEARIDFDQLYNNVIASGSIDHSAIVQNVLNELLAGWLFEIKREFGESGERQVMPLVAPLR